VLGEFAVLVQLQDTLAARASLAAVGAPAATAQVPLGGLPAGARAGALPLRAVPPPVGLFGVVLTTGLPRISTVHQVKGDEAEAVLVLLPKGKKGKGAEGNSKASVAMEEWLGAENLSSEAVRVLYVAAARARRLLAIAVPAEFKPERRNSSKASECRCKNANEHIDASMRPSAVQLCASPGGHRKR
ncbi:MAG: hypothetical protein ABW022_27125, partial [Actinoplanes sp.]